MNAWVHDKRSMSPQRRARLFLQHGPRCAVCTRTCGPGGLAYELDHVTALEKGGTDEDENFQTLCSHCHDTIKTPRDHAEGASIRSKAAKHFVPKSKLKSRGWR